MHQHEHPHPTASGKRYLFTVKHHGGGSPSDACWSPYLSEDEEFSVFSIADDREVVDRDGDMYGVLPDGNAGLRILGTFSQQVAYFREASQGSPWHGYPLWPLNDGASPNRRGNRSNPPNEVYKKMVEVGLISVAMRRLLKRGDIV